jgi:hypothetical protein
VAGARGLSCEKWQADTGKKIGWLWLRNGPELPPRQHYPLVPITPTHTLPFAMITMDFITKLPESGGCDSILTVTDHDCTKAVILVPCKEQMTTEEFLELY